ncbi:MAG: RDD family protein, partial [Bdellovibrionaceae bacterium]|nr:RDD family protein [Pseudobdellovibrionaceae bacterium]
MRPDSSSTHRFFLPKTLNRASAKDRLVAAIIDMILLSVVSSFIIGALGSKGSFVSLVVSYVYFIVAHKIFGASVGKQAMG